MLVNMENLCQEGQRAQVARKILSVLACSKRETDVIGWHRNHSTIGVIFTEIGDSEHGLIKAAILSSLQRALSSSFTVEDIDKIEIAFHFFPEENDREGPSEPGATALYPDLAKWHDSRRTRFVIKRTMDLAGSSIGLVLLAPILLLIGILIKVSSRGPVLIRQPRLGRLGKTFIFYKFRSMYVNTRHDVHREYVKRFIGGEVEGPGGKSEESRACVYKMKDDARITPIGRFLRKTSLDELPQLLNVLRGEMSLVGPRPPIPYEIECYDLWHRGRVLEAKPGITGLWQVKGRSRTTFDEMVRLDIKYIREWSCWLDLRILLETPWAVLSGRGAY